MVTRFLKNSKWIFSPVSLAASRLSIILELISKPLIVFRAAPWNKLIRIIVNNCWIYCSHIFFLSIWEFYYDCHMFSHSSCSLVHAVVLLFGAWRVYLEWNHLQLLQICCSHLAWTTMDLYFSIYGNICS